MGNRSSSASKEDAEEDKDIDDEIQAQSQPSYWQMAKQGYQELVNAIIRPPRCEYAYAQLGPSFFEFCGKTFRRNDFELINKRGLKIVCSFWEITPDFRPNPVLPCLIYMHGNSSARLEGLSVLSLALSLGSTFLAFDFAGSGLSEGDYVSLGAFEKDDLQCVIEHLRDTGTVSTIALWGRSMGAATALLHGERDPSIAGMVLDSAFSDLNTLAEELVDKGRERGLYAPGFVISMAIRFIRASVLKTANFNISDLSPIAHADKCFIPALFVAAEGDQFVACHHSQKIHDKYAGDKNILIISGDHNSRRPKHLFDTAAIFLGIALQIPEPWTILNGYRYFGMLPWSGNAKKKSRYFIPEAGGPSVDELIALGLLDANQSQSPSELREMSIGMTAARQEDIQSNIYSMMGDSSRPSRTRTAVTCTSTSSSTQRRRGTAAPTVVPTVLDDQEEEEEVTADFGYFESDDVITSEDYENLPYSEDPPPGFMRGHEDEEWVCRTCTLINASDDDICAICGVSRF